MNEEEDIRKAYLILGLEAGTEWPEIMTKYKRSVMVWHPDRVPNDPKWRDEATEELKKFNWARDILKPHFEGGKHNPNGPCVCKPGTTHQGSNRTNTGPGRRAKTTEETNREEAEARAKNQERERRAAAEQAAQQQHAHEQNRAVQAMQDAIAQERALKENSLRWKIAIALAAAFIGICFFGSTAMGVKEWWHKVQFEWERDHPAKKTEPVQSEAPSPQIQSPPVVQPQAVQPPYLNSNTGAITPPPDEQAQYDAQKEKEKQQQIYFTRLDIDKYEKVIEHCRDEIVQLDLKLADQPAPGVNTTQLLSLKEFRQKNLAEAELNLAYSKKKLLELTGSSQDSQSTAPTATGTDPFVPTRPSQFDFKRERPQDWFSSPKSPESPQ